MIGIKINEKFLRLYDTTALRVELNSLGYFGEDVEVVPGSYSLPIDIPMGTYNRNIFDNQFLPDTGKAKKKEYKCQIYYAGIMLFSGTARLKDPGPSGARLEVTIIEMGEIKDKPLNEINLGGPRHIGNNDSETVAHAKDTTLNPEDYDYIFFPIWNPDFSEKGGDFSPISRHVPATGGLLPAGNFQNYFYNSDFVNDEEGLSAMPFVKLEYLLERIFAETKFSFENLFQTVTELKRLCLYNNYSIYNIDGVWNQDINLQNHVSNTPAGKFLTKVIRTFCLFPDIDVLTRDIKLRTCNDVMDAAPKHDWSAKVLQEPKLLDYLEIPGIFRYAQDSFDDLNVEYEELEDIPYFQGEVETYADIPAFDPNNDYEFYWVRSLNWLFLQWVPPGTSTSIILPIPHPVYREVVKDSSLEPYESDLMLVTTELRSNKFNYDSSGSTIHYHPAVYTEGTIPSLNQFNEFSDRLIFYRGYYTTLDYPSYPFASSHNYNQDEERIGDYSLVWDGGYGIFNTFWKKWYTMLAQKKEVEMTLDLSLREILNFSFSEKIRIHNQNYLAKSLELTFTMDGIKPTKAHLITVV